MIVSKWTKAEVKALRLAALRLTQEQFAEKVGFTTATIRKWERATRDKPVRNESAEALDTELARLTNEQRARFRAEINAVHEARVPLFHQHLTDRASDSLVWVGHDSAPKVEEIVKRREFGMLLSAALFAAGDDRAPARIGTSDAQRLDALAADLGRREQVIGGAALVKDAVQGLETAKQLLDTCAFAEQSGRAFMSAGGELATIAGWLAYDADMYPLARSCYTDAFALAGQAGDDELTVHVCLNAAQMALSRQRTGEANPHRALALAGRARELTRGRAPGRIHALIATREAQAYAVLGDRTAFGKAISTAWRELDFAFDHESREECPPWLRFVNATEIRSHEARGFSHLGDHVKSADLCSGLTVEEAGVRNSANYRAGSAAALADLGEIGAAVEQGMSVLSDLEDSVSSTRTLRLLEPVRIAAEGRSDEFSTRFDELAGRAIAV
ncbi:helix-turn-helix transcriptional regulator [Nocardia abscessus]|uniref:helix-turn-helix transcriptional regulator n=1 Tax=Nocardia abscessus TaxID=120957 RepID=UPI00245838E9|nr:helix-turn-helix transcriptional regulator [Nocardia abscessus]